MRLGATLSPETIERVANMGAVFARDLARRRGVAPGCELADMEQTGRVAVVDAARRYDPERGVQFKTFAGSAAKFAIGDLYRRNAVVSRGTWERMMTRGEAIPEAWKEPFSLEHLLRAGDGDPDLQADCHADPTADAAYEAVETLVDGLSDLAKWGKLLARLPPIERQAVVRVDLGGETCADLAREVGISHQAVRARRSRGLARLRALVGEL